MKFMLFIYPDRAVELTDEQRAAIPGAVSAWVGEMEARGVREQGHVLQHVKEAATVRIRGGETMVGSGPNWTPIHTSAASTFSNAPI